MSSRHLRIFLGCILLAGACPAALADALLLRPSARMLFRQPDLLLPGACVMYREGGAGWLLTEPVYYLKGRVVKAEIASRQLALCPGTPAGNPAQTSREDLIRQIKASPCVSEAHLARQEQFGNVTLAVETWETPWARKMAGQGRLYQGHFLEQRLEAGLQIELEADLLGACEGE